MQIVFGACLFAIAVILLAYVPGKLLLIALKRTLSPLEDLTLACFLGLVVSGLSATVALRAPGEGSPLETALTIIPFALLMVALARYATAGDAVPPRRGTER